MKTTKQTAKPKQASGGARLKASGRHPVLIGFLPDELADLRAAAEKDGRSVTQFVRHHILTVARKKLGKSG
jgi:hypothetical protein